MRIKILTALFSLMVMVGIAVAQNTTTGAASGAASGSNKSTTGANSFITSSPNSGTQIPLNSGTGNVAIQFNTPSTSLFNSQDLNSSSVVDSTSSIGTTPSTDEILSTQSDLISSTSSFLNGTNTNLTTNSRTARSVLGETIFGDTLVPGMTNVPVVNVIPSTGTTTSVNPNDAANPPQ